MFPRFRSGPALRVLQAMYCEGEFQRSGRYESITAGVIPSPNLLPDGRCL